MEETKGLSKDDLAVENTILALERTLLAMVRTSTTLLTFGFAIYKLMQEKAHETGSHPILEVLSPKLLGAAMIFTGFIGLLLSVIHYRSLLSKMGRWKSKSWFSSSMIISYVILSLNALMLIGAILSN
jgi:putative membrane protein